MRMFTIHSKAKIWVHNEPVRMSLGFPGLKDLVLKEEAQKEDLFVFYNKKLNYIKVLFWAKDGYCLFCKQLPDAKFAIKVGQLSYVDLTKLVDFVVHQGRKVSLLKAA